MVRSAYLKNIIRMFKESKGRFFAILAIVMLGVGFFAGLRVTKATMVGTANKYYKTNRFYDYRLLTNYGFTRDEIERLEKELREALPGGSNESMDETGHGSNESMDETDHGSSESTDVSGNNAGGSSDKTENNSESADATGNSRDEKILVEGSFYEDIIYLDKEGATDILRVYNIPDKVNRLALREGRMPEKANECLLDADKFDKKYIGEKIILDETANKDVLESFKYNEYEVVGLVDSPLYLSGERGTTPIGNGRVTAVLFVPEEGLQFDYYKEAYVSCQDDMDIYTDEYDDYISGCTDKVKEILTGLAEDRYKGLLDALLLRPIMEDRVPKPEIYVLDRNTNAGYAGYSSDTSIVRDIAKIFPIFFFLIAALVCSTTMTRMIDEDRGQIGTFRAMGYRNSAILVKYLLYSGSAGLIGCVSGFFFGCRLFPFVIARAYTMLYNYGEPIIFYFSPGLLVICMIVSLVCTMGTTFLACRNELRGMPAELIRPKAPSAGKRIFLEYVKPLWRHMKFLHKVTARNIFRFKKRMIMMIMGIAGCTALVLTGFGIKDSVSNIANFQFEDIDVYDVAAIFKTGIDDKTREEYEEAVKSEHIELLQTTVELELENAVKSVFLIAAEGASLPGYIELHFEEGEGYPDKGEVILSEKIADISKKKVGDDIVFTLSDSRTVTLRVAGVFENYVWHYAFITPETYTEYFGTKYMPNAVYIRTENDEEAYSMGASLSNMDNLVSLTVVPELKDRVDKMMSMLNAVVWLVIGSAGALAFIVLINLSNINITERKREIATIKVLGFYPGETGSYVFRENFVLTLMGAAVGLPLGIILHSFVISQIKVDMVSFKTIIFGRSYVFAVVIVIGFALVVDLLMRRKLEGIDMAESMKAVE